MRITMNKAGFMFLVIICMTMMATCGFKGCDQDKSEVQTTDTLFLNQWRREKAEKLLLNSAYQTKLSELNHKKDSLNLIVMRDIKSIAALRFKAKYFEDQLRDKIYLADTIDGSREEVNSLLDSLVISQSRSDTACDNTIEGLENIISNQDSAIAFHTQIEFNLKELNKQQELSTAYLTEKLNASIRNEKRNARQNKWLAAGMLLLTGISTTLLIGKALK